MIFLKDQAVLYKKSGLKMSKEIVANIKKAMKKLNMGTEIAVIDSGTAAGMRIVRKKDIPEIPCLVIGKSYYFKDSLLSYRKLKRVMQKWSR
ncbi:MAG: hypothetical protein ABIB71_05245 [Candidatus Woesearchaeota archaeon]